MCAYICYVFVCVFVYVCVFTYVYMCMYECMCAYANVSMCMCPFACMSVCLPVTDVDNAIMPCEAYTTTIICDQILQESSFIAQELKSNLHLNIKAIL